MIYRQAVKSARCQQGMTLTEASLVTAFGALIAVGSFMALDMVVQQRNATQLVFDVIAIRNAIIKWNDGGVLIHDKLSDNSHDPRSLTNWNKIAPYLPKPLQDIAVASPAATRINSDNRLTLGDANPWDGDYVIRVHAPESPRRWSLEILDVSRELSTSLLGQLSSTGAVKINQFTGYSGLYTIELIYEE